MSPKEKAHLKRIQKALDRFPKIVREKQEQYKKRKAFVQKTFGDLSKQIKKTLAGS